MIIFNWRTWINFTDALSVPYDKSMPMWIVQMGNRENSPFSSRGVVISHNGDSGNFYSQSMDGEYQV